MSAELWPAAPEGGLLELLELSALPVNSCGIDPEISFPIDGEVLRREAVEACWCGLCETKRRHRAEAGLRLRCRFALVPCE